MKSFFLIFFTFFSMLTTAQVRVGGGDVSDYGKPYGYPFELDSIDHPKNFVSSKKVEANIKGFTVFILGKINKCYRNADDLVSRTDSIVSLYVKLQQLSLTQKNDDKCSSDVGRLFQCLSGEKYYELLKPILESRESRPYLTQMFNLSRVEANKMLRFFYMVNEVCSKKELQCDETNRF